MDTALHVLDMASVYNAAMEGRKGGELQRREESTAREDGLGTRLGACHQPVRSWCLLSSA